MKTTSSEPVVYTNCFYVLTFRTIYVHNMFSPCSELGIFMYWTCNSMNNHLSYCGLVDARISASEKDLPVQQMKASKYRSKEDRKNVAATFSTSQESPELTARITCCAWNNKWHNRFEIFLNSNKYTEGSRLMQVSLLQFFKTLHEYMA